MEGFDKIRDLNLAELDRKEAVEENTAEMTEENVVETEGVVEEITESEDATVEEKQEMEPQGQYYKADAKITASVMREFLFGHYYRQPLLICLTLFSIGILGYALIMRPDNMLTLVLLAVFLLVGYPVSFASKAGSIVKKTPTFQHTFHYTFDEWGLHLKIGNDILDIAWKYVIRIRKMKNIAVIYTGKNNGYLVPYADLGMQKEEILNFIETMQKNNGR